MSHILNDLLDMDVVSRGTQKLCFHITLRALINDGIVQRSSHSCPYALYKCITYFSKTHLWLQPQVKNMLAWL